mmetsp:Transcript_30016/g.59494  ORF Transcript_30016/g.59494 Transcript_30016/m.59494 type:complete len:83 (-) Transcript_30016:168-416(-)
MAFMGIERRLAFDNVLALAEPSVDENDDAGATEQRALEDDDTSREPLLLLVAFRAAAMIERRVASDKGGVVSMHKNTLMFPS